jgi:dinuclear metal center YbgI/SA1388 family protein
MRREDLVKYLDRLLRNADIKDSSQNGLQVEGVGEIQRVALAVDACQAAFQRAAKAGAQLLIVHHGLFWDKPVLPVGPHYRRLRTLFDAGLNLYACHLPLDAHPKLGHNAELCRLLGLKARRAFGKHHGAEIGFGGALPKPLPLKAVAERLARATGEPPVRVLACGPKLVRRLGCISGGAASMLEQAQLAGFDTYVTGEASHGAFHDAEERGVNVIFGGHYATETLGLKALARHLEAKFRLKTVFLDLPTGA